MTIHMGPVLRFAGYDEKTRTWRLTALVVANDDPGRLTTDNGHRAQPKEIWRQGNRAAYRYEFSAQLGDNPSKLAYKIGDRSFEVFLPAAGMPPQIAYGSCNGFSSLREMKKVKDNNYLWKVMLKRHQGAPYHLLILGGDQVYADSMWETLKTMKDWSNLSWDKANAAKPTTRMLAELEKFYFDLYAERWSQIEVSEVLSRIPTIMMWDDHDIFDGWGSYPDERQNCDVYRAIWKIARHAFLVFQQHSGDDQLENSLSTTKGFSFAYQVGPVAILAVDMRSERTTKQVLTLEHWSTIYDWMDSLKGVDHLLMMSSIPVVYPGFDTVERFLGAFPGQQEYEDDLRDHWNSRPHKGERLRLIHRLLNLAQEKHIRPTIISGDVHVGALGQIETVRNGRPLAINQLISSGIVHPGPPGIMLYALANLFGNEDEPDTGILARMVEYPGTTEKFIGKRNFLSIEPDQKTSGARLWANWIVEGEEDPYTKVILPMSHAMAEAAE